MKTLRIGVVGLGYWGPNWLRNIASLENVSLAWGCDASIDRTAKFARLYPATRFTQEFDDMLKDHSLDAIIIATPTSSHYPLAKKALLAGKHVLIEKPMTSTYAEATELVSIAKEKNLVIAVDHTFLFTTAVEKIQELQKENILGDLLYFDSTRINLGLIQKDCNVLWDLAVHDLSILSAIVDLSTVQTVMAVGSSHFGPHAEDAHMHLTFSSGMAAHIHCSWLSPVKLRQTIIAGKKSMIIYDDIEPSEKIRVYDRGVDHDTTKQDPFFPKYRSGDILIPSLENTEALGKQAKHFAMCLRGEEAPKVSGEDGEKVIRILEATSLSLAEKRMITL